MGIRGDSLWERLHDNVNDNQDFTNGNTLQQTDHTFIETCLSTNSICIPIPMIGSDRWTELAALSNSKEMKPWSVREIYDRPIPRRIAEEAGVKRNDFGQLKAGAGISLHFDTYKRILRKLSPTAGNSLTEFRKTFKPSTKAKIKQNLLFFKSEFPVYANFLLSKFHIDLKLRHSEKYISSPLSSLLIHWSIDTVRQKYKE